MIRIQCQLGIAFFLMLSFNAYAALLPASITVDTWVAPGNPEYGVGGLTSAFRTGDVTSTDIWTVSQSIPGMQASTYINPGPSLTFIHSAAYFGRIAPDADSTVLGFAGAQAAFSYNFALTGYSTAEADSLLVPVKVAGYAYMNLHTQNEYINDESLFSRSQVGFNFSTLAYDAAGNPIATGIASYSSLLPYGIENEDTGYFELSGHLYSYHGVPFVLSDGVDSSNGYEVLQGLLEYEFNFYIKPNEVYTLVGLNNAIVDMSRNSLAGSYASSYLFLNAAITIDDAFSHDGLSIITSEYIGNLRIPVPEPSVYSMFLLGYLLIIVGRVINKYKKHKLKSGMDSLSWFK